jgi:hypothetical protein
MVQKHMQQVANLTKLVADFFRQIPHSTRKSIDPERWHAPASTNLHHTATL